MSKTVAGARTDHWYDETGLTLDTGATAASYQRSPGGMLLSTNTGGATYNYGRDRLGSVTALVNGAGTLANSYSYTSYGYLRASTGTVANPFRFTASYADTGAYMLMGARYYHQSTGRFTQLDPLPKNLLTPNRYEYANSNPCTFTDPTGLDACSEAALAFAGSMVLEVVALAAFMGVLFTPAAPMLAFWIAAGGLYGQTMGSVAAQSTWMGACNIGG